MVTAGVMALTSLLHAQAPQVPAAPVAREVTAANRLPVRRVVLYKSGVGYFEHLGRVRDNQIVTVDFTSGQLDDVLKSLTTLDLNGGRVLGISYNSEAELERRLGALRLPVGQEATRAQLLTALRGARVDVRSGATHAVGRLLSVERTQRQIGSAVVPVETLSIVTEAGEIQTVALDPGVSVRVLEADLNQEIGRYLSLVGSVRDRDVRRVSIATSGTGERELFVSYISEVPVWKPTYRLLLPGATQTRKPLLQGWAVIDNTVGEDWENVELSLVAGAPQSFVQAMSQPLYVQRPVVSAPDRMSLAPQTHQGAMGMAGTGAMTGKVTDRDGGTIPGATVQILRDGVAVAKLTTDPDGRYVMRNLSPGSYQVNVSLTGFKNRNHSGVLVSGGMETVVNATLEIGQLSETIAVEGLPQSTLNTTIDGVSGRNTLSNLTFLGAGSSRMDAIEEVMLRSAGQADANASPLGDLFEYKLKQPVTIRKNQSALVPILSGEVEAEKVSLWNAAAGLSRPLRAVWLTNATDMTLDGGTFSVIEGQAFAGEGLMDPLKAGAKRLLSYAIDLGVYVDGKGETVPTTVTKVQIARGLLIQTTEERQRRTYSARNEDTEARTLVIEHPVHVGWTVVSTVTASETTSAWHRFRVPLQPKTTALIVVDEVRAGRVQYAVTNVTDDQISVLVRDELIAPAVEAALRQILEQKAEVARLTGEMQAKDREVAAITASQDRVRENMKSLKGSAEEKQLLQRYVKQLQDQEDRLDVLRRESQSLSADRQKAQADLNRMIEGLSG